MSAPTEPLAPRDRDLPRRRERGGQKRGLHGHHPRVDSARPLTAGRFFLLFGKLQPKGGRMQRQADEQTTGDLPANIGAPAGRALRAAGLTRLEQLTALSEAELERLHGVGPKALGSLRRALHGKGWTFADEKEF